MESFDTVVKEMKAATENPETPHSGLKHYQIV